MQNISPLSIPVPETLHGGRVLLRPLDMEDAGAVWEAIEESRARLREWMPWVNQIGTLDDERRAIAQMRAHWTTRESLTFGIFDRASRRFLGCSALERINWAIRAFEIGYWIRTSAEGRGYVTEAVQLLTALAFDRLGGEPHRDPDTPSQCQELAGTGTTGVSSRGDAPALPA